MDKRCIMCGQPWPCGGPEPSHFTVSFRSTFPPTSVKRASLFDGVLDTFQSETELNGWRATQGRMF